LKASGELGQIPIIVVFTKYDRLILRAMQHMDETLGANPNPERPSELAKKEADSIVQETCIHPFKIFMQKELPHITTSVAKGYEGTLLDLMKLTYLQIEHVAEEASVAVGKAEYWRSLASCVSPLGSTPEQCLEVIHGDIVAVWNIGDPHRYLYGKEFKALMTNIVDDLDDQDVPNPNHALVVRLSMLVIVVGIVEGLASPAAPIFITICGCLVLAKWTYDVYQQSHITRRRLMAYIVDLTLIMRNLFWLVEIHQVPVSDRLLKFASTYMPEGRAQVHYEIKKYVQGTSIIDRAHRDSVLGRVVQVIDRYRINDADMFKLMEAFHTLELEKFGIE